MTTNALFKRTCPGDREYGFWVKPLKPQVIIGNTFMRANELREGQQGTAGAATTIVHTFVSSPHLHLLPSPPLDAGKYTIPPQVGNLNRRPYTTSVNHRLLLESGRDVSPTGRGPLNQEENIRSSCPTIQARRNASLGGGPD